MEKIKGEKISYDKNLKLIADYRRGDSAAGEELTVLNKPLVRSIAQRFGGRGIDIEELIEIGLIGLVKAINTFDFSRECAFSTYAVPLIFGEIRRFLRDDGMMKVSRENKKLSAILNAERERRILAGEPLGILDIAASVGVSAQDAAEALFSTAPLRSLDEPAYDEDDGATLLETVSDANAESRDFEKLSLKLAIEKLSPTEKKIITLRYFRDYSQCEVAKLVGMTQVKVSRTEKKILERLKKEIEG